MNYKRRKPRTQIKCTLCTKHRDGNCAHSQRKDIQQSIESFKAQVEE